MSNTQRVCTSSNGTARQLSSVGNNEDKGRRDLSAKASKTIRSEELAHVRTVSLYSKVRMRFSRVHMTPHVHAAQNRAQFQNACAFCKHVSCEGAEDIPLFQRDFHLICQCSLTHSEHSSSSACRLTRLIVPQVAHLDRFQHSTSNQITLEPYDLCIYCSRSRGNEMKLNANDSVSGRA